MVSSMSGGGLHRMLSQVRGAPSPRERMQLDLPGLTFARLLGPLGPVKVTQSPSPGAEEGLSAVAPGCRSSGNTGPLQNPKGSGLLTVAHRGHQQRVPWTSASPSKVQCVGGMVSGVSDRALGLPYLRNSLASPRPFVQVPIWDKAESACIVGVGWAVLFTASLGTAEF